MLFLFLLALGCPCLVAAQPHCSSLAGPQCPFVNQLEPPSYTRGLSSLSDETIDLDQLLSAIRSVSLEKLNVTGSFRVVATIDDDWSVNVLPVEWVSKPGPSWVLISLQGHVESGMLVADIVDPHSETALDGCSSLRMRRTHPGMPEKEPSMVSHLEGSWEGSYVCNRARTRASLTLSRTQQPNKLSGLFHFHAQRG